MTALLHLTVDVAAVAWANRWAIVVLAALIAVQAIAERPTTGARR